MNLQRKVISSLVNKSYYYIVKLFLCYVFTIASKDFVFPLLHWSILDFKLERILRKKNPKYFSKKIVCRMDKWNLFLRTNVLLLFAVLNLLIHRFVLFFSILSQKEKFFVKRKNYLVKLHYFFLYFMSDRHIF